jgi:competence protein ComEC
MSTIHFLNVLEGDCNIIQHDSGRITVIDISNASNAIETPEEARARNSIERKEMISRTQVPNGKIDYKQKHIPDNPIQYLKKLGVTSIFRFVITHPDMDHLDGIKDLYEDFTIVNTWDTDNNKKIDINSHFGGYNKEDWQFYTKLRSGRHEQTKRLTYFDTHDCIYWNQDYIKILAPSKELLENANESSGDYHDASYVLLYTPPKKGGGNWKIIFSGDSHDSTWEHILEKYAKEVSNIDVLFAPHHGRDSKRNYDFLKTLNPKVTLFGNASSEHLAYTSYSGIKITNNQAGYVILDITNDTLDIYVKNLEFAKNFKNKYNTGSGVPVKNQRLDAYFIGRFNV